MQTLTIPGTVGLLFDSLADARAAQPHSINKDHPCFSVLDGSNSTFEDAFPGKKESWWGAPTRTAALDAIHTGQWEDGQARLDSAMTELSGSLHIDAPRSKKRRRTWADNGDECDIDKLRRGDYETCWQSTTRRQSDSNGRIIRLLAQIGGNCNVRAESLFWTGAAAVIIVDLLEAAGYRVEIHAVSNNSKAFANKREHLLRSIRLKDADEPASKSQIVATLCMAGFFRTYGLHAHLCAPYKAEEGFGYQSPLDTRTLAAFGLYQPGDIFVPDIRSQYDAQQFAEKTLRELGEDGTPTTDDDPTPAASPYAPAEGPQTPAETREKAWEARPSYTPPTGTGKTIRATGDTFIHRRDFKSGEHGRWTFHKGARAKDSFWSASADDTNAATLAAQGIPGVTFTTS